jgi:hypothetical protein
MATLPDKPCVLRYGPVPFAPHQPRQRPGRAEYAPGKHGNEAHHGHGNGTAKRVLKSGVDKPAGAERPWMWAANNRPSEPETKRTRVYRIRIPCHSYGR